MKHGILRIFPALLHESLRGALLVLYEARPIAIPVSVDPYGLEIFASLLRHPELPAGITQQEPRCRIHRMRFK